MPPTESPPISRSNLVNGKEYDIYDLGQPGVTFGDTSRWFIVKNGRYVHAPDTPLDRGNSDARWGTKYAGTDAGPVVVRRGVCRYVCIKGGGLSGQPVPKERLGRAATAFASAMEDL